MPCQWNLENAKWGVLTAKSTIRQVLTFFKNYYKVWSSGRN